MRPGHKNHFAFRIFNLESLKASEFIQTILSRVAVALVVRGLLPNACQGRRLCYFSCWPC